MKEFSVGYNKTLGLVLLGVGLLSFLLNLWVMLLGGSLNPGLLVGLLVAVIGVLYLTKDFLRVSSSSVEQLNLWGRVLKSYPLNQLGVVDGQVYTEPERKKLAVRWLAKPGDWQRLLEHLQTKQHKS
jgi:hypothetical protein